jgi:hypothetical protein
MEEQSASGIKIQLVCVGKTRAAIDVCFVFRALAFAGQS